MPKNNFYISFGVWLVIIPLLGVPIAWRDTLVFLSGIFFIMVSLGPTVLKKLQSKPAKKNNPLDSIYSKGEIKNSSPDQGKGVRSLKNDENS